MTNPLRDPSVIAGRCRSSSRRTLELPRGDVAAEAATAAGAGVLVITTASDLGLRVVTSSCWYTMTGWMMALG